MFFKRALLLGIFVLLIASISSAEDYFNEKYIPDIATFMQIGSTYDQAFNEATETLYFKSRMSGAYQIYKINEQGWPYQLTVFEDGVDEYEISPNGKYAVVQASAGGSEQDQLFLMETSDGRLKQLTDNPEIRYGTVIWTHDNTGFYYRSNIENLKDFFIYHYDLATDKSQKVFEVAGSNALSDLSADGDFLVIEQYFSNVENDVYVVELRTGKYKKITPEKADFEYENSFMSADNKSVYTVTNNTKDGLNRIGKIDIDSRKLTILNSGTEWATDTVCLSPDRNILVWQTNEHGYTPLYGKNLATGEMLAMPEITGRVKSIQVLNDERMFIAYDSPTQALDIYEWNPKDKTMIQKTFTTYAGIDPALFTAPELIKYKSFDGLEIPAFLYLPPGYTEGSIPFIILAHGGPESQYRPYFVRNVQYFLLNGFGILAPNVRGSSGYGKKYINMDNYKNRIKSVKDYRAGADFLIDNNYTTREQLGVMGGSYGGYMVLALITEYPDLFSAAVDRVGIANFVTFLENTKDYRRHLRETEYGPLSDREFLKSISPIHKAHLIKTPLLVFHGENDPRVPVGEARQIIKAVQDNGGVVDSIIFPDEGHGIAKTKNSIRAYRKIAEFFKEHLRE